MGKRGPKPTHPDLVKLAGNPGHRPEKPVVRTVGEAEKPDHLDHVASAAWDTIVGSMPSGFYSQADAPILSAFCQAYALHKLAVEALEKEGHISVGQSGAAYQNPWVSILNKQAMTMASLGDRLGLSPAARVGLKVEHEKPKSKFEGLIAIQGGRKK
ncbi:phage terminase small subunit P27 family [Microvirga lenta]|uniref:phage terminase small subunit P27 family n=1 Tax=Microvirga lenta TaxID=2881337 RepID=UPI001CFCF021|nr:phage terminase small subunit P27 family [Microvirga lenta]MCB5173656.1 phage terminase small subunit P27 family [Microvirga lenta]